MDPIAVETEAPAGAPPLVLPAELTIYAVGELHPQWRAWAAAGGDTVDAHAVDQVDAAGIQLLVSLIRGLRQQDRSLQVQAPSAALREGCAALGLDAWLDEPAEETVS